MIDLTKEYKTRCGWYVKLLMTDGGGEYPILGAYYDPEDQQWYQESWTEKGLFSTLDAYQSSLDLVEAKPEHTRWIVAHPSSGYATKEDAQSVARALGHTAVVPIIFKEGDGLS